ncbi:MAG: hypothetical protein U9R16_09315 [Campylobacterota bacterium]|nr:hypothetical protein [Campylobacterota bacterium]
MLKSFYIIEVSGTGGNYTAGVVEDTKRQKEVKYLSKNNELYNYNEEEDLYVNEFNSFSDISGIECNDIEIKVYKATPINREANLSNTDNFIKDKLIYNSNISDFPSFCDSNPSVNFKEVKSGYGNKAIVCQGWISGNICDSAVIPVDCDKDFDIYNLLMPITLMDEFWSDDIGNSKELITNFYYLEDKELLELYKNVFNEEYIITKENTIDEFKYWMHDWLGESKMIENSNDKKLFSSYEYEDINAGGVDLYNSDGKNIYSSDVLG